MQKEDKLKDELKDVSFGISAKQTIYAPKGYFDQLPDRVLDRWKTEEGKSIPRTISIRRMIATAAVISGLCVGVTWWTNQYTFRHTNNEISSEDAYQYITEHIEDFAPMILESGRLTEEIHTEIPQSTTIEEYLMEEMEGEDFESIF